MKNFNLSESQISLCTDAINLFIDNMVDMLESYGEAPDDEQITTIAQMKQLKIALSGEAVETLYLRTDSQDNTLFWIETLEEVKAWFIDYAEMYFSDEYSEQELIELYEKIKDADDGDLCKMLNINEYWIEKIQT